jgi:V-type H+-transporting ATPase subunit E
LQKVRDLALERLAKLVFDREWYRKILEGLISQGLFQLTEDEVIIRCRKDDIELVKVGAHRSRTE